MLAVPLEHWWMRCARSRWKSIEIR